MLILINKCIKYFNTIRHLRLIQIIGQLKHSAAISKKEGLLNTYLEKLISLFQESF